MKIGFLLNDLSSGGMEHFAAFTAGYFSSLNIDTGIVILSDKEPFYEMKKDVTLTKLGLCDISALSGFKRLFAIMKKAFQIRTAVKKLDFDILIGVGDIMSLYSLFCSVFTRTKCIGTERTNPEFNSGASVKLLRSICGRFSDGYVFQTEAQKKYYKSVRSYAVIPNAVYNEYAYNTDILRGEDKTVTSMGRLVDCKKQDDLIKAFQRVHNRFPEYTLTIFGEGENLETLEKLIASLGAEDYISLPGAKPDAIKSVARSSVFVLPSLFEGFPNALLEALFCGIPCVSTDSGEGTRQLLENYKNGIIVNAGDTEGMAKAICDILENEDIAEKFSLNALSSTRKYSMESIGRQWIEYFNKILNH